MTERHYAPLKDANGMDAEFRERWIREYFLQQLGAHGNPRAALYSRPKPGDAREPTEAELVQRFADALHIPLRDIAQGIDQAFAIATEAGRPVVSFRYCIPQINAVYLRKSESRAGGHS